MSTSDRPVVQTAQGRVEGSVVEDGVCRFMGIPYAESPAGTRRFRGTEWRASWQGVRPALEAGPVCPQMPAHNERYAVTGRHDEDSLSVNVWTPELGTAGRPVVVFFHGGGHLAGAGSVPVYDSRKFARDGIVAVTCNYRLAAFGLLYLDEIVPGYGSGNATLLDHVRALEWIQENIAAFGGDPGNVTIFGSSAGGISCAALMAMPAAKGLFRRAIPISCAAGFAMPRGSATLVAREYFRNRGVAEGDVEELQRKPFEELIVDLEFFFAMQKHTLLGFGVTHDGVVLPKTPTQAIADGDAAGVDLMMGLTIEEAGARWTESLGAIEAMRLRDVPLPRPNPDEGLDLTHLLGADADVEAAARVYGASLEAQGRPAEGPDLYLQAFSDVMMMKPSVRFTELQARHNPNAYMRRFAWPSPGWRGALGAFHGVPTPFLFDNLDDPGWPIVLGEHPPQDLADEVHGAIIRFASTGDPGFGRYDADSRTTMIFDDPSRVVDDPERERRLLFEQAPGMWVDEVEAATA